MKKFVICLFCVFISPMVKAATEIINWYVDGNTYATTTCQTGGDITLPPAPTKYGYTFQGWAGYVFLEYIQSSGTQYIDTGITINEDSKVDILYSMTSITSKPEMPFGTRLMGAVSDAKSGIFRTHGSDTNRVAFGNGAGTNNDIQGYNSSNTDYNLVVDKNGAVINGTTVATFPTSSITNTFPMYIFACNTSDTASFLASMKLYSFKLYDNNTLVRNMIPAKNASNVVGMYDLVSGQFFTNAGTGEFIAGPLINQ